ncbi:MAG: hypothetical protein WCI67_01545 [Chloroflexales bacterium]
MSSPNRMIIILGVCVALCALAALAGGALWNIVNQGTLAADVAEVLGPSGGARRDLTCQMMVRTRTGYCLFAADAGDIQGVASRLGLDSRTTSGAGPRVPPSLITQGAQGCLAADALGGAEGLSAAWVAGRPRQLALRSGGQFESLLLLYSPATRQACVQVSYAYG